MICNANVQIKSLLSIQDYRFCFILLPRKPSPPLGAVVSTGGYSIRKYLPRIPSPPSVIYKVELLF